MIVICSNKVNQLKLIYPVSLVLSLQIIETFLEIFFKICFQFDDRLYFKTLYESENDRIIIKLSKTRLIEIKTTKP